LPKLGKPAASRRRQRPPWRKEGKSSRAVSACRGMSKVT
jgi:hypothetical protein